MNKLFLLLLIISIQLFSSCENNTGPIQIPTSGIVTINSKVDSTSDGFSSKGFSFSYGEVITYPNTQNILPDIQALVQQSYDGQIIGVYFGAPNLHRSFKKVFSSDYADSASIFFDSLLEIQDSIFYELAIPVKSNEVWAVKTLEEKFGKILIIATSAFNDSTGSAAPTPYGEATFEWVFQPNGTQEF